MKNLTNLLQTERRKRGELETELGDLRAVVILLNKQRVNQAELNVFLKRFDRDAWNYWGAFKRY